MIKNLYLHLKNRFSRGEKSGVNVDYLRRWSKKSVEDKFNMMDAMWKFGEESKKIRRREALKLARRRATNKSTKIK